MTERGGPKNPVADHDEDKRTADVETVKGPMKCILKQLMTLARPADVCEEAALMYNILAEQLSKIEITTLTVEQIIQLLEGEEED